MSNKVEIKLNMSAETAARFSAITDSMNLTNEQALAYLLDLYDKVNPERDGFPEKRPLASRLHTRVRPEIKAKLRQLADEYGLSCDQMLSVLIDVHDQRPEHASDRTERQADAKDACGDKECTAKATEDGGDPMARLETALDMIRGAFLEMAAGNEEVKALREQLAQSQAETRKAKEAYQRKLQSIASQLNDLA